MVMRYYLGFGVGHVHTNAPRHLCDDLDGLANNRADVPTTNDSDLEDNSSSNIDDSGAGDEADEDAQSVDFDRLSNSDDSENPSDGELQPEGEDHVYAEGVYDSDEWESDFDDIANELRKYKY